MKIDLTQKNQKILLLFFVFIQLLCSFILGLMVARFIPILRSNEFKILHEAHLVLEKHSLEDLPSSQVLEYGMIHGMLQKVNDPFTIFVEPAQHELQTDQLQGKYGGIGARLERDQNGYILLYPFPDSPAAQAGVSDGDRLIAIEDKNIDAETSFEEIQALIRGPIDKTVQITIGKTPSFTHLTLSIKRVEVPLPSVTWNIVQDHPNVGFIQINIIAATTPQEVENALLNLQELGASKFIIDLRNNTGGLLQAGVDTAGLFLEKGIIIQQKYKDKDVESLALPRDGAYLDIPIIILVNHGSASGAEIIAGAIQSHERGLIVGSRTYGKDLIQLVFDLSDGSSIHVTAAKWWIPGLNYSIGENGIIPDFEIPDEETYQPGILQIALELLGVN